MRRKKGRSSHWFGFVLVGTLGLGTYVGIRQLKKNNSLPPLVADVTAPVDSSNAPVIIEPPKPLLLVTDTRATAQPALVKVTATTQPSDPRPTTRPATLQPPSIPVELTTTASLAEGRAKLDAGDLVAARRILNQVLASTRGAEEASLIKDLLAKINDNVIFSRKAFSDDPFGGTVTVQAGQKLQTIASQHAITWEFLSRVNAITDPRKLRAYQTLKVIKGPFHAVVSKSAFTMDIYLGAPGGEGSVYVRSFPVGLGKDDSTPTGAWNVEPHRKIKNPTYFSPRGEGIIAADDPKNPLGEHWIGLTGASGNALGKQSYGIHGTIEPDSIGKQESMGCVRLRNEDVALVFELLVEGKSTVIIRD